LEMSWIKLYTSGPGRPDETWRANCHAIVIVYSARMHRFRTFYTHLIVLYLQTK
jgi:hypothetical protein